MCSWGSRDGDSTGGDEAREVGLSRREDFGRCGVMPRAFAWTGMDGHGICRGEVVVWSREYMDPVPLCSGW